MSLVGEWEQISTNLQMYVLFGHFGPFPLTIKTTSLGYDVYIGPSITLQDLHL